MSEATARPWGWSREGDTKDIVIHGPPDPTDNDICEIILADGEYLSIEDATLIVKAVNSHDKLVEALGQIAHDENTSYLACPGPPNCDKSHYPTCPVQIARAALEEAKA